MNPTLLGLLAIGMFSVSNALAVMAAPTPAFQLATFTLFFGGILMTIVQLCMGENVLSYWRRPFKDYLFVVWGIGFYTMALYFSLRAAPPFEANTINYLWPILLVFFSTLINHQQISPVKMIGIVMGFLGAAAIIMPDTKESFFGTFYWGHVTACLAAFTWALYSVKAKKRDYPSGFIAPVMIVSAGLCLVCHLLFEETVMPQATNWMPVILLAFFRVSYAFWDFAIRRGSVILLASVSYFTPLISTSLFILFGYGPERPLIGVGAACVVLGCLVVNGEHLIASYKKFREQKRS
jgi:drug/metabolite transporter (DMT)-like permease